MKASSLHPVLLILAMTIAISVAFADDKKQVPAAEEKAESTKETPDKKEGTEEAATDEVENPGRFAPDYCDFEATFPEKPASTRRCVPDADCYDLKTYTMVYSIDTSIDVSINCTPSTPENFKRYTQPVMKAALAGMVDQHRLQEYEINFSDDKEYRSAALSGTGIQGATEKLFTGQIWVGENSIFTVQAQLVGKAEKVADDEFSEILKSIKYKGGKQLPKKPKASNVPQGNAQ